MPEVVDFMAESLQREETLRKNLLSSVSHELRTPLTIIKAHIEALEDGVVDDPEAAFKDDSHITHRRPRAKSERARPGRFRRFEVGGHLRHFPDFVQNETRQYRGGKEPPQPPPRQAGMCAGFALLGVSSLVGVEIALRCVVALTNHFCSC